MQRVVVMKTKQFEKLVSSIKEAGEIKSGLRKPSRIYEIKPPVDSLWNRIGDKLASNGFGAKDVDRIIRNVRSGK